jgi:hypothetical protein
MKNVIKYLIAFIILLPVKLFPQFKNTDTVYVVGEKPKIYSPEELWEQEADKDISQGKICLISIASFEAFVDYKKQTELFHKYGFDATYMGCVRPQPGYEAYNKKMFKYLDSLNGKDWYSKFKKEYQELLESERKENMKKFR